nr:MAG TPA: hypothetical protein [Caudoviricetes sp.]
MKILSVYGAQNPTQEQESYTRKDTKITQTQIDFVLLYRH